MGKSTSLKKPKLVQPQLDPEIKAELTTLHAMDAMPWQDAVLYYLFGSAPKTETVISEVAALGQRKSYLLG